MKQWLKYEEIKTLRNIVVLATVLVGLNLWLYYDDGIYLKFTIPLGVATILLFVLKNTALSFLLALLISCICLEEAPASEFLAFIRAQLDYTILTVLAIGGFMALLNRSGGSEQLNIYIRKWCKTVKIRKLAGVGITAINCFSSTATVAAMHLLFKEDLESKRTAPQDKLDLIRIMLMFSNISCTLISVSLWWVFFGEFKGVAIKYSHILPYLFYPLLVIACWAVLALKRADFFKSRRSSRPRHLKPQAREIILEQRQPDHAAFCAFFVLPVLLVIIPIILKYGLAAGHQNPDLLFNKKNFILGAFAAGSLALGFSMLLLNFRRTHLPSRQAAHVINQFENTASQIQRLARQLRHRPLQPAGKAYNSGPDAALVDGLAQRARLSTPEKKFLQGIKSYYHFEMGPIGSWFGRLFRHMADTAALIFNDFMDGAKSMSGTAMVLIAALAFKAIIATENQYLYPGDQICRILIDLWPLPIQFIPALLAILTTIIGLVIGSSWGVFAVMFPFIMMVKTVLPDEHLALTTQHAILNASLGAVISAATFINQSSKQADNLVVAADLTGMNAGEILAITRERRWICAILSLIGYFVVGFLML